MLRDIWADLVDKRLWPLALALVLALVAMPLVLLEPAASPKPAPAPVADAGPAPMVSNPSAVAAARPGGPVVGELKNPFEQQHVPKKASTTSGGSAAGPGTTTTSSGGDSGGTGGGDSSGGPNRRPDREPGSESKPKPESDDVKRVRVRFGRTDGKAKVRVLSPGAPLPSVTDPMIVFVEVGAGNRAEFLVSSDAVPQGDGRCKPSKAICAQLFVKPGDTQFFDVTRSSGPVQYQLEVLGVVD